MNCWDFMKCQADARHGCPAYPDRGLECWKVTGTMCNGGSIQMASVAEKIAFCRKCEFYQNFANKF